MGPNTRHEDRGVGVDTDADLVMRAIARDETAMRAILRANNRRLYRIARSVVGDDGEAEDVLQEAYLKAFAAMPSFRHESSLATWLTRIVLNEAMQQVRRRKTHATQSTSADIIDFPISGRPPVDPEQSMVQTEICRLLERAIDDLPEDFRTVLVARTLEGLSIEDTAALLDIRPETVKTRLHRARKQLRAALAEQLGQLFDEVYPFDGARCDRFSNAVIGRILAAI